MEEVDREVFQPDLRTRNQKKSENSELVPRGLGERIRLVYYWDVNRWTRRGARSDLFLDTILSGRERVDHWACWDGARI